jgi:putative hemolysin
MNGVFAGAEIAVLSVRRTRLRAKIDEGSVRAGALQRLRDNPENFLATVQIGITIVGATAAAYGGGTLARRLAAWLHALGIQTYHEELALATVVGIVSYLSLVLGELVPKSLALRYSEGYAFAIGRPLLGLSFAMRPLVWFLTASSNAVLRLFHDQTTFTETRHSSDELQQLVEESTKAGALDPRVGEIASRAFDFSELAVVQVMVPANRIVALRRHATPDEIQRVLLEQGHARMPVYEGSLDNIVGYIIAKDLLALAWERHLIVLEDLMRPVYFVPEAMRALDALKELQHRRTHLAIVVDENSGVSGLITIEDLVEELVGEIFSEHEQVIEILRREGPGTWLVQGTASIRDVNRELPFELPESPDYATVAGLCIHLAGAIPQAGKRLRLPGGAEIEVVDASVRRVRAVRIHAPPARVDEELEQEVEA